MLFSFIGANALLFKKYYEKFVAFYLRQTDDRAWPPVKAMDFVNLSLVKNLTSWRRTVQHSIDDIAGDKTHLSYIDLTDTTKCGLILLQGRPGSGKTTMMTKLSTDWANGTLQSINSKLLILVYLRQLNERKNRTLSTIVQQACPALSDEECSKLVDIIKRDNGKNVVFAFDGLDEYKLPRKSYPSFLNVRDDIVIELMRGNQLSCALVMVTSRPAACIDHRHYAINVEVLGFLKEQVFEYVQHYFNHDEHKGTSLISHLKQHPKLMELSYLPLHCAMLVFLYEVEEELPETETEFYEHFTLSTLLRSVRKRQGIVLRLSAYDQLPPNDKILFDKVCKLAFNATIQSKQVLNSSDLLGIELDSSTGSDESSLGLVVIDRYFMRYGVDEAYTFLHLTFQEYLAAVYIAGLSESDQIHIIEEHADNSHLSVVWNFFCGILGTKKNYSLNVFQKLMRKVNVQDKLFKVHCCHESQNKILCTDVIRDLDGQVKFENARLRLADCVAIGFTISQSEKLSIYLSIVESGLSCDGVQSLLQFGAHFNLMVLE